MTVINQFMWEFQSHFRSDLESFASDAFGAIGFGVGIRAHLIGFATRDGLEHPVCFESERDPLAGIDFSGVPDLVEQLIESNPESRMQHSHRYFDEQRREELRDEARADAVRQTMEQSPEGAGRYFFVGRSRTVDGSYAVHPILSVPRARWDSKPTLAIAPPVRRPAQASLQHALVFEILAKATEMLGRQHPPEGLPFMQEGVDEKDFVRWAAQNLTQSVIARASEFYETNLYSALDAVASQPYEGRVGYGRIILAAEGHREVNMLMQFLEPMPLNNARLIRKALEMTGDGLYLICDGKRLIGLGSLLPPPWAEHEPKFVDEYRMLEESLFEFDVLGRGVWEMSNRGTPLLRVTNTQPSLPKPPLGKDEFVDIAGRLFPGATPEELDALWLLAEDAAKAEHGTMLVIHRAAATEAERLLPQAQRITATHLESQTLQAVTAIDGAVLVDPSARCHAVGVILDGRATGSGDPSRGARYNSAIRYQKAVGADCLVVIVSEDGMIDLVPRLRRRIRR